MAFAGGDMKIAVVIEAYDRASAVFRNVSSNVNTLGKRFGWLKDVAKITAGVIGGFLVIHGLNALRQGIEDCINSFAKFEYTMTTVANIAGMSGQELSEYNSKLLDLAKNTIYTAQQLAEASLVIAKAGIKGEMAFKILEAASKAAQAAGEDLNSVLSVAISTVKAFGVETEKVGYVMDVLVNAALNAKTSVSEIGTALSYVGAVAQQVGWSIEDVVEAIILLQDRGLEGSKAGMYLRQAIMDLIDPTAEAKKVMEELGIRVKDASGNMLPLPEILNQLGNALAGLGETEKMEVLAKIFDTRPASAMALLLNVNREQWEKLGEAIRKQGTSAELSAKMMETTRGRMLQLQATMEALKIEIGAALAPAFIFLAETAMDVLDKIKKGDWLGAFMVIRSALEKALIRTYEVLSEWWSGVVSWFRSIDWMSVAYNIGVGIYEALYNGLFNVFNAVDLLLNWLDSVLYNPAIIDEWIEGAIKWVDSLIYGFESKEDEMGTNLLELFGRVLLKLAELGAKLYLLGGILIVKFFQAVFERIAAKTPELQKYLHDSFTGLVNFALSSALNLGVSLWEGFWGKLKAIAPAELSWLIDAVKKGFETMASELLRIWDEMWNKMLEKARGFIASLKEKIMGFVNSIVNAIRGLYNRLVGGSVWIDLFEEMVKTTDTAMEKISKIMAQRIGEIRKAIGEIEYGAPGIGYEGLGRREVTLNINVEGFAEPEHVLARKIAREIVAQARLRGVL